MDESEELIEFLKSEEAKVLISKSVQEMIEKNKKEKEIIEQLFSNKDYIQWLIDFTKDKEGFFDSDWDYSSEKLSDSNKIKVNNLALFFNGIYNYAKKNYIYPLPRALGEYYQIKIDDIGFEVGYITGQGISFYCKRIPLLGDNFIDFMGIVNNKEQDYVKYIDSNMEKLSNMIIDLYNKGIPIEAIDEAINKSMKQIISFEKEKEQPKVFSKTL